MEMETHSTYRKWERGGGGSKMVIFVRKVIEKSYCQVGYQKQYHGYRFYA